MRMQSKNTNAEQKTQNLPQEKKKKKKKKSRQKNQNDAAATYYQLSWDRRRSDACRARLRSSSGVHQKRFHRGGGYGVEESRKREREREREGWSREGERNRQGGPHVKNQCCDCCRAAQGANAKKKDANANRYKICSCGTSETTNSRLLLLHAQLPMLAQQCICGWRSKWQLSLPLWCHMLQWLKAGFYGISSSAFPAVLCGWS